MKTETTHDYEIAREELNALFAESGLKATVTNPHVAVDEDDGKGWSHVAVTVTFSRPERRTGNGAAFRPAVSVSFLWKMGLGLADWKKIATRPDARYDPNDTIQRFRQGKLADRAQRDLAAKYLPYFVAAVNPAEVLARVCSEGLESTGQGFEDWAANFSYYTDSRKAERTYLTCQEQGAKARRLVDADTFTALAELANRL